MGFDGLNGRIAVVTGANRGIGRAIADTLHRHEAHVAYLDIETVGLDDAPRRRHIKCDVSNEASVHAAFSEVEALWGPTEILVNNAGILEQATVEGTSLACWERIFAVNTRGTFLCTRRALPGMRQARWGRIVNVGSTAGKTGGSGLLCAYASSKGAILTFTKSVASEVANEGITVNALAPALIQTDMITGLGGLRDQIPVGRLGTTDDVCYAVLFLISTHASYMTGEILDVNGGFHID